MNRQSASNARQTALDALDHVNELVRDLVAIRSDITPGTFTRLLVRCGRKNCRCAKGDKHEAHFLYVSRGGPLQRIWIPVADRAKVKERADRYRRFRSSRAAIIKASKQLITSLDQLEAALTVPYRKNSDQ
jgi:hypothetical protein